MDTFLDLVEDAGREDVWYLVSCASRTSACGLILRDAQGGREKCFGRVGYFKVLHRWVQGVGLQRHGYHSSMNSVR